MFFESIFLEIIIFCHLQRVSHKLRHYIIIIYLNFRQKDFHWFPVMVHNVNNIVYNSHVYLYKQSGPWNEV